MSLAAGTRLGSYEVHELIGVGGMGEVYRARDAKLQREVALKTLPPAVALDPDRLLRFKREAQLLAGLNHSNIAAIYGFEESAGVQALVLEFVEGPTLEARIGRGAIPLDDALPIASQIADALEAAHARGVIHRDLKPANIKVRADGTVKVLDFGLAKAVASEPGPAEMSGSPTITSPALTRLGVILGTAAYMSPEQARGREADVRSDIWAFGCVLYEMLTGRRPFDGSDVSDTLASILKSDPEWQALSADVPSNVRRVLRRCLEKDPRRRFHHIADVRLDLQEAPAGDATAAVPMVRSTGRVRDPLAWSLLAIALLSLAGVATYVLRRSEPPAAITRFQVYPPPNTSFGTQLATASKAVVSPDGTRLVFAAADRGGRSQLWMRPLDSFEALPVAGSEGASLPFWSPDSRSIGFVVGSKLKKIDAAGGTPQTICDVDRVPRGASWSPAGDIVFSAGGTSRLYRVPDRGGRAVPLSTTPGETLSEPSWPAFLPDGRSFLYWARDTTEGSGVYARTLGTDAAPKRVVASDSQGAYDPSGLLLFTKGGVLLRQRFDPVRFEVSGEPTPVVEGVSTLMVVGGALFSVSNNGVLTFQPDLVTSQFTWVDRSGNIIEKIGNPGKYAYPNLSPDRQRLAYVNTDGNVWVFDLNRKLSSKITSGGTAVSPVWSTDGQTIFYKKPVDKNVAGGIYRVTASAGTDEALFFEGRVNGPSQVSRDGRWLLYFASPEGQSVQDIYVLPMTGERKPQRIVQSPYSDVEPQLSPDGRFVAYASSQTGRLEVFVQPFPATGERWQISDAGGRQPLWREDGKELYFVSDIDQKFYATPIKAGPKFDYGPASVLFEMRANVVNTRNSYVPSVDGKRFLVNMALEGPVSPINVIRNWRAGLKE